MKVLVGYSSAHGSTREIAQFIGKILQIYDLEVTVADAEAVSDAQQYDTFVLGTAIHAGIWLQGMLQFMDRFRDVLARKPTYFFITCIRILEEDGYEHVMENYLHHDILKSINVREVIPFAGKLEFEAVDWEDRWLLAVRYDGQIMPGEYRDDYRNWQTIASWAHKIADELGAVPNFKDTDSSGQSEQGSGGASSELDSESSDVVQS
jgi:menaquinone-dependent protoporphyrinogen oxidase